MENSGPGPGSGHRPRAEPGLNQDCIRSKAGSGPSGVSLSSNFSKDFILNFPKEQPGSSEGLREMENSGPGPGSGHRPRAEPGLNQDCIRSKAGSGPSGVSLSSNFSKDFILNFPKEQTGSSEELRNKDLSLLICQEPQAELDSIFQVLEEQILRFVRQQLQRLHRLLASDYPECSESEEEESKEVLTITLDFLKKMDQEHLAQRLFSRSKVGFRDKLKCDLQQKFSYVFQGVAKAGDSAPLTQIYTELYITEGGASEVNQEHEVRHMETTSRRLAVPETITCEDLFKARPHSPEPIRFVLTKGVAGVGKTVLTQKFSLDWAEGRAHQDLQLLFPFTFRELNVLRDSQFSLVGLLHHFFSPSKDLCSFQQLQVLFIFDGLDECRLPLDFSRTQVLTDPAESASVHVLLVNLIRGKLLPSARIWITTRPAAANQIPAECVSIVTEVRGFADSQKEQYFRKRFRDQATAIISHIKRIRSLHIMCHIPVFCWILSTVLQNLLKQTKEPELPRTLTRMYAHFLVVQAKVQSIKYHQGSGVDLHWTPETREMVWSLGKLAFEQLQKGNLIFYESDLSECGLDAAAASVYSGVFTQVFRQESGLYQDKVYCFIHLSVQEFMAALHVHQSFYSSRKNLLDPSHSPERPEYIHYESENHAKSKEDFTVPSENLEAEETRAKEHTETMRPKKRQPQSDRQTSERTPLTKSKTLQRSLKSKFKTKLHQIFKLRSDKSGQTRPDTESPESDLEESDDYSDTEIFSVSSMIPDPEAAFYRSAVDQALQSPNGHLDLFLRFLLGLSLLTNQSLLQGLLTHTESDQTNQETVKYIKQKLNEKGLSAERSLNLVHCLNELHDHSLVQEVQKNIREGSLSDRNMSPAQWSALSFVLLSSDSDLEEFDLRKYQASENALLGLLPVVRASTKALLIGCGLSPNSCGPLASVLSSSSLTHLDLSHNDLQDSGVELLCSGLKSAPCRLETLKLSGCLVSERGGAALASALSSAPTHLRELDLSCNHPGSSAKLLMALQDQRPLLSVRLDPGGKHWMVPGLRKYSCEFSLDPNTTHRCLLLSEDYWTVRRTLWQEYLDHKDRFTNWPQVLSCTGLRGRCYWEVDWRGAVDIGVSYRGIKRSGQGRECVFGFNDHSWNLYIYGDGGYYVRHNSNTTRLPLSRHSQREGMFSGRVGVFLDSEAGALSFYDISSDGELFHIWTFSSSFSEPLFPGFGLYREGSTVALVKEKRR